MELTSSALLSETTQEERDVGPISVNLIWTVVWSTAILAVFAPLAVRRYRKV
jgi:hypothetical protein